MILIAITSAVCVVLLNEYRTCLFIGPPPYLCVVFSLLENAWIWLNFAVGRW